MSNTVPNTIDLKLTFNEDGSAILNTINTIYDDYDIILDKAIADNFIDDDETKYYFSMSFNPSNISWVISLKFPNNGSQVVLPMTGDLKQEGKQITCILDNSFITVKRYS